MPGTSGSLNSTLFMAIIIHRKSERHGRAVRERELAGLDTPMDLLMHVSPLGCSPPPHGRILVAQNDGFVGLERVRSSRSHIRHF